MPKTILIATALVLTLLATACNQGAKVSISVDERSHAWTIPLAPGYGKGVAAPSAGYVGDELMIAGGCNFPDTPAAEGGRKVYYDDVYITRLDADTLSWLKAGSLPTPLAYAATCVYGNALIIAGGKNNDEELSTVLRLFTNGRGILFTDSLAPLPLPRSGMASALIGSRFYLIGGSVEGKPTSSVIYTDLSRPDAGWSELPPLPGNTWRKVTAAASGDSSIVALCSFSTAPADERDKLDQATYVYKLTGDHWEEHSPATDDEGSPIPIGGGMGITLPDGTALFMGGVNKERFHEGLDTEANLREARAGEDSLVLHTATQAMHTYLTRPIEWYAFNPLTITYHTTPKPYWSEAGRTERTARADAALVSTPFGLLVISGELKPGIRTPRITLLTITHPNTQTQ